MTSDEFLRIAVLGMIPSEANAEKLFDAWWGFGKPRSIPLIDFFWFLCDQVDEGIVSFVNARKLHCALLREMSEDQKSQIFSSDKTTRYIQRHREEIDDLIMSGEWDSLGHLLGIHEKLK